MNGSLQILNRRMRSRRGMTLIEIIIVIAILGVMMSAAVVALIPALEKAKRDTAAQDLATFKNALDIFYARKSKYPDTGSGLKALVDAQVMEKVPLDPWQNDYLYLLENGKPVIKTYAKDGQEGGEGDNADISSKDLPAKK